MDLRDTPEEAAFRQEIRDWLEATLGDEARGRRREINDFSREWSRKVFDAGYSGLTWPKEYGGAGAPYSFQAIMFEEWTRAEAPQHIGVIGLGVAGARIMAPGP